MEIIDEVREIIATTLSRPVAEIAPETRLSDMGVNSLDVIEIVFALEERFAIEIPLAADVGRGDPRANLPFETIGDVAKAVKQHIDAKPAA